MARGVAGGGELTVALQLRSSWLLWLLSLLVAVSVGIMIGTHLAVLAHDPPHRADTPRPNPRRDQLLDEVKRIHSQWRLDDAAARAAQLHPSPMRTTPSTTSTTLCSTEPPARRPRPEPTAPDSASPASSRRAEQQQRGRPMSLVENDLEAVKRHFAGKPPHLKAKARDTAAAVAGKAPQPPGPAAAKGKTRKKPPSKPAKRKKGCGQPDPASFVPDPRTQPRRAVAREFEPNGKVLAFTLTCPDKHDTKAVAVNRTYAPGFDKHLFMSSAPFRDLDVVVLPMVNETRKDLWIKTQMAWLYVFNHYGDQYDWFMKADDDTMVLTDNLRRMLKRFNPQEPHYLGRRFALNGNRSNLSYMSGGAGYVLSREALRRLGVDEKALARRKGTNEDTEMGRLMRDLSVPVGDTRDADGRETFLPFRIGDLRHKMTRKSMPKHWYWRYSYFPAKEGLDCCSTRWITTHYTWSFQFKELLAGYRDGTEGSGADPPQRASTNNRK